MEYPTLEDLMNEANSADLKLYALIQHLVTNGCFKTSRDFNVAVTLLLAHSGLIYQDIDDNQQDIVDGLIKQAMFEVKKSK